MNLFHAAHICKDWCRYLAAQSEADHYARELKREQDEIIAVPDIGLGPHIYFFPFKLTIT